MEIDILQNGRAESSLKGRSVRGGAVTVASQAARFVFQLISTAVLARLLTPADFGLVAMVLAITNFAFLFRSAGLSAATVQRRDVSLDQVSNLFWINVGFGIALGAILVALAPAVAWFYDEPRLVQITMGLATMFVFYGFSTQHRAVLLRSMRFGAIAAGDISGVVSGVAAALVAAYLGAGYWSLVVMHVTTAAVTAVAAWIALRWLPSLPKRGVNIRELLGFGGRVTAFDAVNYFSRNMDNLLIGRVLGSAALGFYSRAYSLMMLPIRQLRTPLMGVGLPALSKLQDDPERYARYYSRMVQLLSFVVAPVTVFLGTYASELVRVVLGPGWESAATVFAILAPAGAIQAVAGTNGMVMLSSGNGRRYFRFGVAMAVLTVGAFVAGLPFGIRGVAGFYSAVNVVALYPMLKYSFKHTPVQVKDFFRGAAVPYLLAIVSVAITRSAMLLVEEMHPLPFVLIGFLFTATLYIGGHVLLKGGRQILREVRASLALVLRKA
mgnify:CR=1 FL=1